MLMARTSESDYDDGGRVPARGAAISVRDDTAMRAWAEALVARAREENVELTGESGLLTGGGEAGAASRA
jgi:hypothetical protein